MKKRLIIASAAFILGTSPLYAASGLDTIYLEERMHGLINEGRDYTLNYIDELYKVCQDAFGKYKTSQENEDIVDLTCECISKCLTSMTDINTGYPAALTEDNEELLQKEKSKMMEKCTTKICNKRMDRLDKIMK